LAKLLLWKNERRGKADVVLREADKMDLRPHLAVEAVEIFHQKRLRQLSRPISAKVGKENGVAIAHALLVRLQENQRRHELVGLAKCVLSLNRCGRRRFAKLTTTKNDCIPGFFRAVPPSVTIHCEIAA